MDLEKDKNGNRKDQFDHLVVQVGHSGANRGSGSGNVEWWLDLRYSVEKQSGHELLAKYDVGLWVMGQICCIQISGGGNKLGVEDISVQMSTFVQVPVGCPFGGRGCVCLSLSKNNKSTKPLYL